MGVNRVLSSLPFNADQVESIIVKAAQMEDCDDLWLWRNDPHTRAQSLNSNSVPYDQHCKWFESAIGNPELFLLIGTMTKQAIPTNTNKIGMVRFDLASIQDSSNIALTKSNDKKAIVSINVNPDFRGKGFAVLLLNKAVKAFKTNIALPTSSFNDVSFIEAIIKEENTASIKCFEHAGFTLINPKNPAIMGQRQFHLLLD